MDSRVSRARSAVGVAHRRRDPEAIKAAKRELAAANIETYIEAQVAAAPPLTAEQRTRLAGLLAPYAGGDAA